MKHLQKRNFILGFVGLSLFLCGGCGRIANNASEPVFYKNPVFDFNFADPSVVKAADGWFYAYATQSRDSSGLKFIPIIKSRDLVNWSSAGQAFDARPDWKKKGGLWAPDVTEYKGRYYMFYSVSVWGDKNPGIGHAVSDSPEGPFTDLGKFFLSEEIGVKNSIDPFFIEDLDGSCYLFWGSFHGIYGIEIEWVNDRFVMKGDKFQIAGNGYEATYLHKRNDYYYFFGSIGSCCDGLNSKYHVKVARSVNIKGPYLDSLNQNIIQNRPILGNLALKANDQFVGPGHNSEIITDDEGTDWMLYHAIDVENPHIDGKGTRRPMLLDRVDWDNEWPFIPDRSPSSNAVSPIFKKINATF